MLKVGDIVQFTSSPMRWSVGIIKENPTGEGLVRINPIVLCGSEATEKKKAEGAWYYDIGFRGMEVLCSAEDVE